MRILHAIETIDPAGGGPQAVVMRLAAAQARLGHAVSIVAYGDAQLRVKALDAAAGTPGLEAVRLRLIGTPDPLERLLARRAMREAAADVAASDFVHLHGVWERLLTRVAGAASRLGIPYCVRPAGMLDPWSLQQKRRKKVVSMWLFQRTMLDRAAFIHTLNRDERAFVARLGLRAPLVVISNGVSAEEVDRGCVSGRFRPRVPGLGDAPFVLFLGRLHSKKGLDILAEAFGILARRRPDVHLVVAGPDDGDEAAFRAAVAASGLGGRVHLTGPLYGPSKFEALADAACFCLPSRQEGFSVAVIEALASGVPVAISEGCHFPEVGQHGAGRVVALDPCIFAAAIEEILNDPAAAARMGANGRRLVAERYTWSKIAAETIEAYAAATTPQDAPAFDRTAEVS